MSLPLAPKLTLGVNAMHRRSVPETGTWQPAIDELAAMVGEVDRLGFDTFWCGDHIAFGIPFLDPIVQIAQAAAFSRRLTFGIGVFLLPLRHPTPVAKQIASLDHITEGRLIFGVGVGGEFPKEYESSGVPMAERGARLGESIEVIRKLWTGEAVSQRGRFFAFENVQMTPPPRQPGGPPIWCGGRHEAALRRAARLADGWFSYANSLERFAKGLDIIGEAAEQAQRRLSRFDTAHLMFARVGDTYERALAEAAESLSLRYGKNLASAAERYGAVGTSQDVATRIRAFYDAGARHVSLDFVGPIEQRSEQLQRFAADVRPLLADITI